MTLHEAFSIGERMDYGQYTFTAEAIMDFARKYDPQPFHVDPQAAKLSIFGGLCASGWHTAAVWMKKNLEYRTVWEAELEAKGVEFPKFGPSPGFRNMKWPKPVFANDTVNYDNMFTASRALRSKPNWGIVEMHSTGTNQHGETVISFDSAALVEL